MVFLRVGLAKAVCEEGFQRDVFLADEALLRQIALGQHIEHRTDCRSRGDLDAGTHDLANLRSIDLIRIGFLNQTTVLRTRNGDKITTTS